MPPRSPYEIAGFVRIVDLASQQDVDAAGLLSQYFDAGVEVHLPAVGRRLQLRGWRLEPAEDFEIRDAILEFVQGEDGHEVPTPESYEAYEKASALGVIEAPYEEEVSAVVLREAELFELTSTGRSTPSLVRRPGSTVDEELVDPPSIEISDVAVRIGGALPRQAGEGSDNAHRSTSTEDVAATASSPAPATTAADKDYRTVWGRRRAAGALLILGLGEKPTTDLHRLAQAAADALVRPDFLEAFKKCLSALARKNPTSDAREDVPSALIIAVVDWSATKARCRKAMVTGRVVATRLAEAAGKLAVTWSDLQMPRAKTLETQLKQFRDAGEWPHDPREG